MGVNFRFFESDDADFGDHAGQAAFLGIGVHDTGGAGGNAEVGHGEAHVNAGQAAAQAILQAEEALGLARGRKPGEMFLVEARSRDNALDTGGHAVGAVGATLGPGLVGEQLTGRFRRTDINDILERSVKIRNLLNDRVDGPGLGLELVHKGLVDTGHMNTVPPPGCWQTDSPPRAGRI